MNDFTVFLYLVFFVGLLGATFAFTFTMMRETMKEFNKPRRNIHPEMEDVKSGEQLLVFNANRDEDDDGEDDVFIVRRWL